MTDVAFFVEGEPRAKQSFRSLGRRGGYTPALIKAWQSDVAWCAQMQMRRLGILEPLEGNLSVELVFFLGNHRKIDLDNLSKAVLDGLNGAAWVDDRQNISLTLKKYVCRERQGVLVKVTKNLRPLDVSLEQMKHMIGLAPFGLEPKYVVVGTDKTNKESETVIA